MDNSLQETIRKFEQKKKADNDAISLQLMKENNANEQYARLHSEIDRIARHDVEGINHCIVGNFLSVLTKSDEIQVIRKECIESLKFSFDFLYREVQIVFEGKIKQHKILRVDTKTEPGSDAKPILVYQRLPSESFETIKTSKLQDIVQASIEGLIR